MMTIDLVFIISGFFWLGFFSGTYIADRFWAPLWREALDGYERVVLRRIEENLNRKELRK